MNQTEYLLSDFKRSQHYFYQQNLTRTLAERTMEDQMLP